MLLTETESVNLWTYISNWIFLWEVNLGPRSENEDNISPRLLTINLGYQDSFIVSDFNSDEYAKVAIRIANSITFSDSKIFIRGQSMTYQYIAMLDRHPRALHTPALLPTD
jgi:flavoprotein